MAKKHSQSKKNKKKQQKKEQINQINRTQNAIHTAKKEQEQNTVSETTISLNIEEKAENLNVSADTIQKNTAKTFDIKTFLAHHRHGTAIAATLVVTASVGVFATASYLHAQSQLQASKHRLEEMEKANQVLSNQAAKLEDENAKYSQSLEEIQKKTIQLENKMTKLENTKQNLADELNSMKEADTAEADTYLSILNESPAEELAFTNVVTTSYNKTDSLANHLNKLDVQLDETGISFGNVAEDVTVTLAAQSNIPQGFPVNGIVTTEFNPDGDPSVSDGRVHKGMDISTRHQVVPISATAAGTVITSEYHSGYGNYVCIDHGNGYVTLYAHNSENLVSVGDSVKKGDTIAMAGSTGMSTGIHCHYEIHMNGISVNPRDFM